MTFKSDMMAWSPQLEENCAKLAAEAETEADKVLIAMVRISRICVRATAVQRFLFDESETGRHVTMHIASLKTSLETLSSTLSESEKCHGETRLLHRSRCGKNLRRPETVVAYLIAAEVAIYELAILPPHVATLQCGTMLDHQRLEYLMACMRSCQMWTDCYLNSNLIKMTTVSGTHNSIICWSKT
jgi:hypothetical protein